MTEDMENVEAELKQILFEVAKHLTMKNVKDLMHIFSIPDMEIANIKTQLQLMQVLLRLDMVSVRNTKDLKENLANIGRKDLRTKLNKLEEELAKPKTEDMEKIEQRAKEEKREKKLEEQRRKKENPKEIIYGYPMNSIPCGKCLIINNRFYSNERVEPRYGSDIDAKNLENVFQWLNFKCEIVNDVTNRKLAEVLDKEMDDSSKENENCFVLCLLTYGKGGDVYTSDGVPWKIQDVIKTFDDSNCIYLKGKPKLFFIQACQVSCNDGCTENSLKIGKEQVVFYASTPATFRSNETGSWFIHTICFLLRKHGKRGKLYDVILGLRNAIIINTETKSPEDDIIMKAFVIESLLKSIQFHPHRQ